ncbi:MAG TPA: RNA methyltransferase [Caldisericia bacterium]|nr:RNA methyltransferase [Caldisericia bacterium]
MNKLFVALVHYPVSNKNGDIISTSITPFDVHDIARSCLTFGVSAYYVINPSPGQKKVVDRLIQFWDSGFGKTYNPNRTEALAITKHSNAIQETIEDISLTTGSLPLLIATSAKTTDLKKTISMPKLLELNQKRDLLLLLGTGWGLAPELFSLSDYILEPIYGLEEYNHLSVRAAAAIMLYQYSQLRKTS